MVQLYRLDRSCAGFLIMNASFDDFVTVHNYAVIVMFQFSEL